MSSIPPQNHNQNKTNWAQLLHNNLQILIVDDEPVFRMIIKDILEDSGATIFEAENGQEAIDIFDKTPLDLILMDLNMPVMNGFEAISLIREKLQDKFIPIITVNAFNDEKILQQALECGADDYLVKPANYEVLISKINSMIRIKNFYDREHELRMRLYHENQRSMQLSKELNKAKNDLELKNQLLITVNEQLDKYGKELEIEVLKQTNQLRQKDLQLIEKDREVSLYSLASGMAHEINNPLGFVKSSLLSLHKRINKLYDQTLIKYLDKISVDKNRRTTDRMVNRAFRGIDRIINIINYLKRLSNVDMEETGPLNLNISIDDTLRLIKTQFDTRHATIKTYLADLPEIICARQKINICIYNIIKNSLEAIKAKEKIDPEFKEGQVEIISQYSVPPARITVQIIDNGIGMTDEERRQAFDPFYTQKPIGEGSGIGLTMADTYVKKHDGQITINSEKNKGTTVTLTFPVQEKA
jgi:signal transduction histidine kinase